MIFARNFVSRFPGMSPFMATSGGGCKAELELDRLSNIVLPFNELFGNERPIRAPLQRRDVPDHQRPAWRPLANGLATKPGMNYLGAVVTACQYSGLRRRIRSAVE